MKAVELFVDDRLTGICVFCGAIPETRDHAPSNALLDEPLPPGRPWVDACKSCNESFSLDEEYVACFVECVLCATTEPAKISRPKIARTLAARPNLAARIEKSKQVVGLDGNLIWTPELDRVRNVVLKLAKAHSAYELSLPRYDEPAICAFSPLIALSHEQQKAFERPLDDAPTLWPEIGSRAFLRLFGELSDQMVDDWIITQPGRYRYRVDQMRSYDSVHFVLSEYLACRVVWA